MGPQAQNDKLPKGSRAYFSVPQTKSELKEYLLSIPTPEAESLLRAVELPEAPSSRSVLVPDTSPPLCVEKHVAGGTMQDRDCKRRPWNDRWCRSVGEMNDRMHKAHRAYFTKESMYESAPSQAYRRYRHQEVAPGDWR